MAVSADRKQTLLWLEYYGLSRVKGKSPAAACVALGRPTAEAMAQLDTELGIIDTVNSVYASGLDSATQVMTAMASALPIVGGLASTVMEALAAIAAPAVEEGTATCKKGCGSPVSYERRRFVDLDPPPIKVGTYYFKPLAKVFHDGLVMHGAAASGPEAVGRMNGVFTRFPSDAVGGGQDPQARSKQFREWYNDPAFGGEGLPKGEWRTPWNDPEGTWYSRAWRVQHALNWAQHEVPCAHLMCCAAQLFAIEQAVWQAVKARKIDEGMGASEANTVGLNTAGLACRMKGSRWYASIYWLWRDFWELGTAKGVAYTAGLLRELDESDAASELEALVGGKTYAKQDLPFPWMPVVRKLGWTALCTAVRRMAISSAILAAGPMVSSVSLAPFEACRRAGKVWYNGQCITQAAYDAIQQRQEGGGGGGGAGGALLLLLGGAAGLYLLTRK